MRRFSLILFDQVRSFTRRVVWPTWLAAGLAGTLVIFWYVCSRNSQPILYMSQTVYGQAILTLTFMMMGIELRREHPREHLDDIMAACPCPPSLLPLAQIAAMAVMAAAVTLIVEAGCLVPLAMDHASRLWLRQTALQIVLLYFLPCLIMGIWGLLISHLRPGKGVYFPAILVWLLTSSLSVSALIRISSAVSALEASSRYRYASNCILSVGENCLYSFDNQSSASLFWRRSTKSSLS